MRKVLNLRYGSNTKQVEDEGRLDFLKNLLDKMGVPTNDFWSEGGAPSIIQRKKIRGILTQYKIHIDDIEESMSVYVESELVAKWNKMLCKIKRDLSQEPKKQLYIEMTVDSWTIFDNEKK